MGQGRVGGAYQAHKPDANLGHCWLFPRGLQRLELLRVRLRKREKWPVPAPQDAAPACSRDVGRRMPFTYALSCGCCIFSDDPEYGPDEEEEVKLPRMSLAQKLGAG